MRLSKTQKAYVAFKESERLKLNEPPVAPRVQTLPLTRLEWRTFEHLCIRIVEREPGIIGVPHLYGVQGDYQAGIDIIARKKVKGKVQKWDYQCKKYNSLSAKKFQQAIDNLEHNANYYVFFLASEAGVGLRKIEEQYENVELWDVEDISRKLKKHHDLIADFFHPAWVEAFCGIEYQILSSVDMPDDSPYHLSGTIYDPNGYPIQVDIIKAMINNQVYIGKTHENGEFTIALDQQAEFVHLERLALSKSSKASSLK